MPPRFIDSGVFTILDLLDADGGWLTSALFHEMIPMVKPDSIDKSLIRLRDRGLIESRPRLSDSTGGSPYFEHRITPAGRDKIDMATAA